MTAPAVRDDDIDLRICPRRRSAMAGGREVVLPDLSFRLLKLLAERAPDEASYAEIEAAVWNARVTRETMKQRVTLLRDSLREIGIAQPGIEAVRNVGYRTTLRIGEARPAPRRGAALALTVAAGLAAAGFAGASGYVSWRRQAPLTVAIESGATPALEPTRRILVRDLSKIDGVRVIEAGERSPGRADLVARLTLDRATPGSRLSTQLIERRSGSVLFAERYVFEPQAPERAIRHFANNAHGALTALSLDLGRQGYGRQSTDARAAYVDAFGLWRRGDVESLRAADARLDATLAKADDFLLAKSLRARVRADLVLRHGADIRLAQAAEREAGGLVKTNPAVGDFRYSLARAKLAAGDEAGALAQLREAARTLPFLDRDIQALERQIEEDRLPRR